MLNKLLAPMVNFNLKKNIIFSIFHGHKNTQFNILSYFGKLQILGCYSMARVSASVAVEDRSAASSNASSAALRPSRSGGSQKATSACRVSWSGTEQSSAHCSGRRKLASSR